MCFRLMYSEWEILNVENTFRENFFYGLECHNDQKFLCKGTEGFKPNDSLLHIY